MAAAASKSLMRTESPSAVGRPVATATKGSRAARSVSSAVFESDSGGGRMMPPTPSASSFAFIARSALLQQDLAAGLTALLQHAHQQFIHVGGAGIVVKQPDVDRGCLGQI